MQRVFSPQKLSQFSMLTVLKSTKKGLVEKDFDSGKQKGVGKLL